MKLQSNIKYMLTSRAKVISYTFVFFVYKYTGSDDYEQ